MNWEELTAYILLKMILVTTDLYHFQKHCSGKNDAYHGL